MQNEIVGNLVVLAALLSKVFLMTGVGAGLVAVLILEKWGSHEKISRRVLCLVR